jgi:hypothetical protein
MVEARNDKWQDEKEAGKRLNELLVRLLLGSGSRLETAFNQFGIFLQEIKGDKEY